MKPLLLAADNKIFLAVKALLGFCLLSPLFVWPGMLFPFTGSKAFFFRITIEIAFALYFYLALRYRPLRPKRTLLFWSILVFLGAWLISALVGVDSYLSFWGNLERMGGVWGLLHFVLFFVMLTATFKTKKEWSRLFLFSLAVGTIVALLGLLQRFVGLGVLMPQSNRVYSTLGNSGVFGAYLIFNIFLAVYLWRDKEFIFWHKNILLGAMLGLQILVLLLTGTRGAWLGFLAGVFVFTFLLFVLRGGKKARLYFAGGLTLAVLLAGSLVVLRDRPFVKNNATLNRLASFSLSDTTSQNRLILWHIAWQGMKEKPVFGWGPENYATVNERHFDDRLNRAEAWYDRAHNFIFDYGSTLGFFGLLSYLSILAVVIWQIRMNAALTALFAGYLVQNLFIFDSFVSFLMLFFVLAAVGARLGGDLEKTPPASLGFGQKALIVLVWLLMAVSVFSLNIKTMRASSLANDFLSTPAQNVAQDQIKLKEALAKNTFASGEISYQAVFNYLEKINQQPVLAQNEDFYQMVFPALQKNVEISPARARNFVALGWLDLYFSGQNPERVGQAIEAGQKVISLAPNKKEGYLLLTAAYSISGQTDKADEVVAQAEQVGPVAGKAIKKYLEALR